MAISVSSTADAGSPTFACSVAAYAAVEAPLAAVPALREQPASPMARAIPPRFLRYADEQTVVGLAAVLRAIDSDPMRHVCFDDWGVLAAPRFPGRVVGAAIFSKFLQNSQTAVSPHMIPQHSMHSVSGAISIALGMHGPNFGIGGGPEVLAEGLTVALTFLDQRAVPGIWLVMTQWNPEPVPDGLGSTATTDAVCSGVAMALVPGTELGCVLRMNHGSPSRLCGEAGPFIGSTVPELAACLATARAPGQSVRWSCLMPWGGDIELTLQEGRQFKAA